MNKERRQALDGAIEEINKAKGILDGFDYSEATDLLESAKSALEEVGDEEQEAFDNLSEGLQQAERGQRMEEIINELVDVASNIAELIDSINEQNLTGCIDEIVTGIESCKD